MTGAEGPSSAPTLLAELGKIAKGGGVTTYIVRLLDDGSDRPATSTICRRCFRSAAAATARRRSGRWSSTLSHGKETLVRGVALENLLPRSFKEVTAIGNEPVVYNYLDGGGGFSGVPSTIIAPSLLFPDVDIRRQPGKHRKPPVYPSPLASPAPPAAQSQSPQSPR